MSLISASRWLRRGEDVVEVLLLLLVQLAEEPLAQHLREADDRVQRRPQLVRHVREELGLVPARGLELAALLVELGECGRELPGALLDLLLEARVRLLELRRHAVELLGERAQLVVARDLDPLVERPRADLRRRGLDRLDRPDEPAGEQYAVAMARSRNATSRSAVRQIADSSGANASLSGSSTKTCQPSGSIVWKALSTSVPSWSCPIVAASAGASPARAARLVPAEATRSSCA